MRFTHRGEEWAERVAARRAVRYDIIFDPDRGRWYLDASWKTTPEPAPDLEELRTGPGARRGSQRRPPRRLCPRRVGQPGRRTGQHRRWSPPGWRRPAVMGGCGRPSPLCSTTPSNTTVRRSWWRISTSPTRGPPGGKPWAAANAESDCAAPWPVSPPRGSATRLTAHGRPPRHRRDRGGRRPTPASWGNQHWRKPLQQQTSDPVTDRHHGAAAAIGQTWPRPGDQATAGRTPQRTADRCGHSTGQARHQPSTTPRRCRSSGPPTHPPSRRAGPPDNTHRQRPTPFGPHRTHSCSLIRNGTAGLIEQWLTEAGRNACVPSGRYACDPSTTKPGRRRARRR